VIARSTLDQRLVALEAEVPALMADRNAFPEAFEERAEQLVSALDAKDHAYAWRQLEAIVERSGFNG
jgi:hypothetical protein